MQKRILQVGMLALGIVLLWLAFRGQDWEALLAQLQEADYRWAVPVLLTTLLNHWVRARRWQLLIRTLGCPTRTSKTLAAILVGYLVSYAVPRLGEVTRCGLLSDKNARQFPALFGTVIVERSVDVLSLLLIGVLALLTAYERLVGFVYQYLLAPVRGLALGNSIKLAFAFTLYCIVLFLLLQWRFPDWAAWLRSYWQRFRSGLYALFRLRHRLLFLSYTLLLWLSYFGMTYLWFFAFRESQDLPVSAGMTMLFIGGIARSLPIQGGGMGAYHFLFAEGVALFGIGLTTGSALAVVIHGFQSMFYLVGGAAAWGYLLYQKK